MKYANFCDTARTNINIGDYFQFMAVDYVYNLMGINYEDVVRLGFVDLAEYDGSEVILPFFYSIIDFVKNGKIAISRKIKPVFFSVTLSTVDKFIDVDEFLQDSYNKEYLTKYAPVGCRDEATYMMFKKNGIPAYINGCMTVIFPRSYGSLGNKVIFADTPKSLFPYIPKELFSSGEIHTQQHHFSEFDIMDYRKIFEFVKNNYDYLKENASLAVTSRLHVALPLTAFGIPVILAKENVDARFSFIESYIPIYDKNTFDKINWTPNVPDIEPIKNIIIKHTLGRITGDWSEKELQATETFLTEHFSKRKIEVAYKNSYETTHRNSDRFDEYAAKYWSRENEIIKYALWGASLNNADFWKNHIESNYQNAKLVAVFDRFKTGELFNLSYQNPDKIEDFFDANIIVCAVGAVNDALKLFSRFNISEARYCITSDVFLQSEDIYGGAL